MLKLISLYKLVWGMAGSLNYFGLDYMITKQDHSVTQQLIENAKD